MAWHQDLTISVNQKYEVDGFGPWTVKHQQFAVQPPVEILENIVTIRIHLDDTGEHNGALKVIPGSHLHGIQKTAETIFNQNEVTLCPIEQGGIMLMKPLIFHSSARTTNAKQRRVIHLELASKKLPSPLQWAEHMDIF